MVKKVIALTLLLLLAFQGVAFATDTSGEIVFRDAIYGAIIGAVLGGAAFLMDGEEFAEKMGVGIAIGTIGGLIFGVMETRGIVGIQKGGIKISTPTAVMQKKEGGNLYSISFLKANF